MGGAGGLRLRPSALRPRCRRAARGVGQVMGAVFITFGARVAALARWFVGGRQRGSGGLCTFGVTRTSIASGSVPSLSHCSLKREGGY